MLDTLASNYPNRNSFAGQIFFYVAYGIFPEVKDTRGQNGISFAFEQDGRHVLEFARATARDNRHSNRLADAARYLQIEAGFGAIGIDAVEHDFASAERNGAFGPFDRVQAGWFAAAVRKDLPLVRSHLFSVNRNDDALAPEFFCAGANQIRIRERGGVDADLVSSSAQHGVHVFD